MKAISIPRLLGFTVSSALILCASAPAGATDRMWAEHPFAAVKVGIDPAHGAPIYDLVVVGLVSPDTLTADDAYVWSHCTDQALAEWTLDAAPRLEQPRNTTAFVDPAMPYQPLARVDAVVSDLTARYKEDNPATAVTAATVSELRASRIKEIGHFLESRSPDVVPMIANCAGETITNQAKPSIRIVFSLMRCPVPKPAAPHPCHLGAAAGNGRVEVRERAYAQVAAWLHSDGVREHGVWVETPHLYKQAYPVVVAKNIGPPLYVVSEVPIEQRLAQFSALAVRLRADRRRALAAAQAGTATRDDARDAVVANIDRANSIAPEIPLAIGLTQESAAHVIDLIQQPMYAVEQLRTDAELGAVQMLPDISDEVARSRIIECVQLRKVDEVDLTSIATCSGYHVTDDTLRACLNHQRCFPKFNASAYAEVVRITQDLDLSGLAAATLIPRLYAVDFDQFTHLSKQCGQENAGIAKDDDYETATMRCVLIRSSPEAAAMMSCITGAGSDNAKLIHCASLEGGASVAAKCWQEHPDNNVDVALCVSGGQLPPGALACIDAYRSSQSGPRATKDCLRSLVGGGPIVSAMLTSMDRCTTTYPNDKSRIALCMAAPALSHDEAALVNCATKEASWNGFAGCALASRLPGHVGGDLGKVLDCGIRSGGNAAGTAICLVGPRLNHDQQILLQCAAASGGVPATFAACAGGQLALREFINCRKVHFGEEACFGKNNDIRKLAENLGIHIGPGTPVGKILDVQLDLIKGQVQISQAMLHGAGDLLKGVGRAVQGLASDLKQASKTLSDGLDSVRKALGIGNIRIHCCKI